MIYSATELSSDSGSVHARSVGTAHMNRDAPTTRDSDARVDERAVTLVVGGGRTGLGLASELVAAGRRVTFVGETGAANLGESVQVDATRIVDPTSLREVLAAVDEVAAVVAVGPDSEALLVAHLARRELPTVPIVAVVDDPFRRRAFEGLDVGTVSTSTLLAGALRGRLSRSTRA